MKFVKATTAEKAALVRMVVASAELVIFIGRTIKTGPGPHAKENANLISAEFVAAIVGVQEASE